MNEPEAHVEYVILNGSTESDEQIDAVIDIVRHSLRTQFGCKLVTIAIEERLDELHPEHSDEMSYH